MEVGAPGAASEVPGPLQRTLLGALLLAECHVLDSRRLVDEIWGDRLPAEPRAALWAQVARLRHLLEAREPGGRGRLERRASGYCLRVLEGELDLDTHRRLRLRAHLTDSPEEAADLLRRALTLWRGPAFADVRPGSRCEAAGRSLDDSRQQTYVELAAIDIRLGRASEICHDVEVLTIRYPLNEALYAQLIQALLLTGRRADAIAVYHRARRQLAESTGLDPGPVLQQWLAEALGGRRGP
ncbi:hypothetical protein OHV13_24580 [Kitasatospora purpeofusca]|uniref:AfsR/SARP family transcriptional regulator n=1 Tax=Kitasatospora purpeofusca TaxID=67352 RepID=UPI00324F9B98